MDFFIWVSRAWSDTFLCILPVDITLHRVGIMEGKLLASIRVLVFDRVIGECIAWRQHDDDESKDTGRERADANSPCERWRRAWSRSHRRRRHCRRHISHRRWNNGWRHRRPNQRRRQGRRAYWRSWNNAQSRVSTIGIHQTHWTVEAVIVAIRLDRREVGITTCPPAKPRYVVTLAVIVESCLLVPLLTGKAIPLEVDLSGCASSLIRSAAVRVVLLVGDHRRGFIQLQAGRAQVIVILIARGYAWQGPWRDADIDGFAFHQRNELVLIGHRQRLSRQRYVAAGIIFAVQLKIAQIESFLG